MLFLTAAVILTGALCLLDLLLTLGVVRRLREHTDTLAGLVRRGAPAGPAVGDVPSSGTPIGEFTATTIDGESIWPGLLAGHSVAVFLAPECSACREQVPALLTWAAKRERRRTLVVLDGQLSEPTDLVDSFNPVATVVVETSGTPVTDAFGVSAFPSFCVVNDSKVLFASLDFTRLPAPAPA